MTLPINAMELKYFLRQIQPYRCNFTHALHLVGKCVELKAKSRFPLSVHDSGPKRIVFGHRWTANRKAWKIRGFVVAISERFLARAPSLRVGLYARISTHDQQTLPAQLTALRAYAKHRGWSVAMDVKEVGSGAKRRAQREAMMDAARRREIDAILVWRLDRWGRSLLDLIGTLNELSAWPRSHVRDRRSDAGSLRICLVSAATTVAVSLFGTLISATKRE